MKHFFTISLCFLALSLSAQETITYPYNPDGDADGTITVPDLQDFLGNYGGTFSPSDILVDGETLATVLTNLQNSIDSLSALTGGSAGSVLDMPIGTILPVASEAVPEGWVLCDGREVAIDDYQAFYDLIGTTYGAGDSAFWAQVNYPASTFNIPDLRGRTIIGADNMGGESAGVVSQHPSLLGKPGGSEMHQITEGEMPSHSHVTEGQSISSIQISSKSNGNNNNFDFVQSISLAGDGSSFSGGDQPHNNMQPYIALNYMVKVKAAFDVIEDLQSQIDSLSNLGNNIISYVDFSPTINNVVIEFEDLTEIIVCRLTGGPFTLDASIELPTENVPEGFSIQILNNGIHGPGGSGIQLSPGSGNDTNVKNGYIGSWTYYDGLWYTIYEKD